MSNPDADPARFAVDDVVIRLQTDVYGMDAIAKAAHRFTDRCFVQLERENDEYARCRLRAKRRGDDLSALEGEFMNEVLDQMLRAKLEAETEQLRLLLLAHAFSNTSILHPELEEVSPLIDPFRIGLPDEGAS